MVTISQFKAKCLGIIAEVQREKRAVTITKNGRAAVRIVPYNDEESVALFGRAAKSTIIRGDLMKTDEEWDAQN